MADRKVAMRRVLKDIPYRFCVIHPTNGRTKFAIEKRTKGAGIKAVDHSTLDAINEAFRKGTVSRETAHKNVLDLREQLYKEAGAYSAVVHNSDNRRVADEYWRKEYGHRELVDPATARYEIDRAVEAMGMLSLLSATGEEIQNALKALKLGSNKHRRVVAKLYALLAFAGRGDVRIWRPKPEKKSVRFLTEAEYARVRKYLPSEVIQTLHDVAFYTGGRIGELFAMEPEHFSEKNQEIRVKTQIDRKSAERATKNRRERTAIVFEDGVEPLKKWFQVKRDIDMRTRRGMAAITRAACQAAFPSSPRKHLVFHDLRHCYAVMLREVGLTTEDVADLIGDSLIVAKEHYSGFGESDAIMGLRRQAIQRKPKRAA